MRNLMLGMMIGLGALSVQGQSADYFFVPPEVDLMPEEAPASTAVSAQARAMMSNDHYPHHQIDTYAGQAEALQRKSMAPDMQVGAGVVLDWTDSALFDTALALDGTYHWRASVQSVDASAIRLKVDLSSLHPDAIVRVMDVAGNVTGAAYQLIDTTPEGRWLPTVLGDTAVLWVESPVNTPPDITVTTLSHYYTTPFAKGTNPCPIPADCITDPALQEVSTGIGRLTVTDDRGTTAFCSGALINNANSEALETYFLTANHCFEDIFSGTIFASALEIIWDFRSDGCNGPDPSDAEFAQLPRSAGASFLQNSQTIDAMLLSLDVVPVGTRGRAYIGWDTREPRIDEAVVGLHHPATTSMKESIGFVRDLDVNRGGGIDQTELQWTEGLTEGGSSGSPSMFADGDYRIFGMLSTGNRQFCNSSAARIDQYSSFRDFFNLIGVYLIDQAPPNTGALQFGGDVGGPGETPTLNCAPGKTESFSLTGNEILLIGVLVGLLVVGPFRRTVRS